MALSLVALLDGLKAFELAPRAGSLSRSAFASAKKPRKTRNRTILLPLLGKRKVHMEGCKRIRMDVGAWAMAQCIDSVVASARNGGFRWHIIRGEVTGA